MRKDQVYAQSECARVCVHLVAHKGVGRRPGQNPFQNDAELPMVYECMCLPCACVRQYAQAPQTQQQPQQAAVTAHKKPAQCMDTEQNQPSGQMPRLHEAD